MIPDILTQDHSTKPVPTPEQQAIIDYPLDPGQSLKVIAYAGTGKTSTLVQRADAFPDEDILYLAFNKSVETEAKQKFGPNVLPKTIHALAYASVGRNYKDIQGGLKAWDIARHLKVNLYEASIIRNSLENFLNSAEELPQEEHVVEDELLRLKDDYKQGVVLAIESLFKAMCNKQMTMTHNCYLKAYALTKPNIRQSTIFLDEAQDTNPVTLGLVLDQMSKGKKVIMVGDPYQQIYSWRGAVDAMAQVQCDTLRITQSFRFGSNIANIANRILSQLLKEPIPILGFEQKEPTNPKSAVICRTNSGLFAEAVSSVISNLPFSIIGEQRFNWLLDDMLDVYHISRRNNNLVRNRSFFQYKSYEDLCEKAETTLDYELQQKIALVSKYQNDVPHYVSKVRQAMQSPQTCNRVLVTGHQAKGLEWANVSLSNDFPDLHRPDGTIKEVLNKRIDRNDENRITQEEINLLYVACTRAKNVLNLTHAISRLMRDTAGGMQPSTWQDQNNV